MPDGSIAQHDTGLDAFTAMHKRLLRMGLILRGGGRIVDACREDVVRAANEPWESAELRKTRTPYREPDPSYQRRDWTQPQIDAAGQLHNRVTALPIQRSLVLQAFYFEEDAEFWNELTPAQQWERIVDLTTWTGKPPGVNARIHEHNAQLRQRYGDVPMVPAIIPEAFMPIRHRAIRELVARERGIRC